MSMKNLKYFKSSNKFYFLNLHLLLSLVFGLGFILMSCGSELDMYRAQVYEDDFGEDNGKSDADENKDDENSLDSIKQETDKKSSKDILGSIEDILDQIHGDDDSGNDNIADNNKDNNGSDNDSNSNNPKVINFNGYKCYSTDMNICEIEYTIFKKTNEYRVSRGLSALSSNMSLSYTARDWSKSQARSGYISHSGFPNSRERVLSGLKSDSSLDANSIGSVSAENVAATGYSYSTNAAIGEAFVNMWINSYGHRMNIVGSHKFLGVGVVKSSSGMYSYYATQIFGR